MMIATDSIHGYVIRSFQNSIDRLGLVKAELKSNQEPRCGKFFGQVALFHESCCDCDVKTLERELGAWRTRKFDNSRTAASTSHWNTKQKLDLNMC